MVCLVIETGNMRMTYILVAYLAIAGQTHSFVVDHDLTKEDCRAAIHEVKFVQVSDEIEVPVTKSVKMVCIAR